MKQLIRAAFNYYQSGNFQQAENIYREILTNQPNNVHALYFLGIISFQRGNYDLSIEYFKKVIYIDPRNGGTYVNLGDALREKKQIDEAIISYQKAIQLNPTLEDAYNNLGVCFKEKGLLDEALIYYQKALQLNPKFSSAYNNLGVVYNEKQQYDKAISCYQKAFQINPNSAETYNNLGCVLQDRGDFDSARVYFKKALQLNPNNADAHLNLSFVLLLSGNFMQGWKEFSWRLERKDFSRHDFSQPLWDGANIDRLTILLHTEQGLGDTIQFIRYSPLIAQKGAKVIVACQREVGSLLRSVEGIEQVIEREKDLPEFDVYCPLLSLPLIFNTTLESIPAKVPYIKVDSLLVQKWRNKVQYDDSKLKIGLVWAGKPEHKDDRNRSCLLDNFSPLAELSDIAFYSLQKGAASEQAKNPPKGMKFIDYTEEISDFSDTAALIQNLDLIVSVDTSVVHLAGALGKPVWTLIPFSPDWRWMLNREDSPWYPTMRLFRQPSPGDWESVITKVKDELLKLLGKN
jgi:tetratricopeptide (TPR) repeat protein